MNKAILKAQSSGIVMDLLDNTAMIKIKLTSTATSNNLIYLAELIIVGKNNQGYLSGWASLKILTHEADSFSIYWNVPTNNSIFLNTIGIAWIPSLKRNVVFWKGTYSTMMEVVSTGMTDFNSVYDIAYLIYNPIYTDYEALPSEAVLTYPTYKDTTVPLYEKHIVKMVSYLLSKDVYIETNIFSLGRQSFNLNVSENHLPLSYKKWKLHVDPNSKSKIYTDYWPYANFFTAYIKSDNTVVIKINANSILLYKSILINTISISSFYANVYSTYDTTGLTELSIVKVLNKGVTTDRPSLLDVDAGFQYFDTTLNKPVWWKGTTWVSYPTSYNDLTDKPNIPDTTELTKVVYTNHIYANISATPNTIYKNTATEITLNYSGGIAGSSVVPNYTFKKGNVAFTMPDNKKETINTASAVTYHVDVSAGGVTKGADATVNAYYPYYTFGSAKASGYTAEEITAGTKQPARYSPAGATHSIAAPANGYWVIAYADGSVSGATIGGFNAPLTKVDDVTINGVVYHIYRCAQPQTAGTYSVTFK